MLFALTAYLVAAEAIVTPEAAGFPWASLISAISAGFIAWIPLHYGRRRVKAGNGGAEESPAAKLPPALPGQPAVPGQPVVVDLVAPVTMSAGDPAVLLARMVNNLERRMDERQRHDEEREREHQKRYDALDKRWQEKYNALERRSQERYDALDKKHQALQAEHATSLADMKALNVRADGLEAQVHTLTGRLAERGQA